MHAYVEIQRLIYTESTVTKCTDIAFYDVLTRSVYHSLFVSKLSGANAWSYEQLNQQEDVQVERGHILIVPAHAPSTACPCPSSYAPSYRHGSARAIQQSDQLNMHHASARYRTLPWF